MGRRDTNDSAMRLFGKNGKPSGEYVPSKADLFDILKKLKYRRSPEIRAAMAALDEATRARRDFEKSSKTWMRLHRKEVRAKRELDEIASSSRDAWEADIADCWDKLRLYGPTPQLVARIEELLWGNEED